MNGTSDARRIVKLQSKEYRDALVESHARTGISFQLRAMRAARGWSQEDLGEKAGMGQNVVARLENPDYGKFSNSTLLKLASAFDVGLLVRFVGFGELLARTRDLSPEALDVPSFGDDQALQDGGSATWAGSHAGPQFHIVVGHATAFAAVIQLPEAPRPRGQRGLDSSRSWTTLNAKPTESVAARAVQ